ncbi:MAG: SpoIVB peptidase S55 domain-containing protein [Faecousia sp.]
MKRQLSIIAFAIALCFALPLTAQAAQLLIPGGQIIGLQLQNGSVTVAAFDDILGANARDAGIQIGDEILSINGRTISCAEDVRNALNSTQSPVTVAVRRGNRQKSVELTPQQTEKGPRLGLYLKQGITGIGTVSWYDPETSTFGTLGHGVNDSRGVLLNMTAGTAYHGQVMSVKKGLCGEPGLLKGSADALDVCGQLLRNTPQGVFGVSKKGWQGEPLPVASFQEVEPGPATIRSTIAGSCVQEYSVEILKIYPEDRADGRNFLLKVKDEALLSATGGIVQGMSGSPIIQNGKLVGAVTHVLVNDPTTGYGIFIENMLDAAA